MKDRREIEQAIFDKIVNSFNMNHPADEWLYDAVFDNGTLIYKLYRKDGLHLAYYKSNSNIIRFIKPTEFKFNDRYIENKLCEEIIMFLSKLKADMVRKKDEDSLNAMINFFDLDLKK